MLIRFTFKNIIGFVIAPLVFLSFILFVDLEPEKPAITYTLAVAILMAIWWIIEVVPLSITSELLTHNLCISQL